MPFYRFTFQRKVETIDEFEDYVEADDIQQAQAIASRMAERANSDCPDWTQEVDHEYVGDWSVETSNVVTEVPEDFTPETKDILE